MTYLVRRLGFLIVAATGAYLPGAEDIDHVDFGDPVSEQAHAMTTTGQVSRHDVAIELGTIRERRNAVTLAGRDSQATITLHVAPVAHGDAMLEIEEIHQRQTQTLGYTVSVNGQAIYFRTYDEMAAGPNHYFVRVPASVSTSAAWQVSFRSQSATPVSLGRVWAYADFTRLAAAEGTYQPMAVAVEQAAWVLPDLVAKDQDGKPVRKADPAKEAQAWSTLGQRMQGSGYAPGFLRFIGYPTMNEATMRQAIDQALDHAIAHGVDLNLAFNGTEWGAHPSGPDGLGGYFSDITYSKVIFQDKTKDFRATWYGTPGNTTWPTWNNAQLNDHLGFCLTRAVSYFQDRRDLLAARGAKIPRLVMNQEWGFAVRDFNDATTSLAKKDGVTLDPEYRTEQQKKWVFDNACASATRFSRTFDTAARANRVIVDRGEVRLPTSHTRDDNYFQGFADPTAPYFDDQWAGWQICASPYAWATGELLPHLPEQYFDYINARGKLAGPNMERACLPTLDYYQVVYQRGFRLITPLNPRAGETDNFLPQAAGMDARPAQAPLHVDRQLLNWHFSKQSDLGPKGTVVGSENMLFQPLLGALGRERIDMPSSITYQITNPEPDAAVELVAKLNGKIAKDGAITLAIGPTIAACTTVATLGINDVGPDLDFHRTSYINASLGRSVSGLKAFFLRMTFTGKYSSSASVKDLRISALWPQRSGSLVDLGFTMRERRTCNLWIQDRAVYEHVAADYRERCGADAAFAEAQHLAAQGHYQKAYQKIAGAAALAIPAGFAVHGHGQLGSYPIEVRLSDDDAVAFVTLTKADAEEVAGTITADRAVTCTMALHGVRDDVAMALDSDPQRGFRVYRTKKSQDARKVVAGSITWEQGVAAPSTVPHRLPAHLSGTFLSAKEGSVTMETQDPAWWRENPLTIPLAPMAQVVRRQAGGAASTGGKPMVRDHIELTIDATGTITAMTATFGKDTGQIKAFTPPTAIGAITNGIIELTNGHRYELSNQWGFTNLKDMPPLKPFVRQNSIEELTAAFTPGKSIDIDYCPYVVEGRLPRAIRIGAPGAKTAK